MKQFFTIAAVCAALAFTACTTNNAPIENDSQGTDSIASATVCDCVATSIKVGDGRLVTEDEIVPEGWEKEVYRYDLKHRGRHVHGQCAAEVGSV